MKLPFMSRLRKRLFARDIHQDQYKWFEQEEQEMEQPSSHPSFTCEDTRIVEEVLTEILCLACNVRKELRLPITNIAEGLAAILPPDAVERCKDYVKFRVQSGND